MKYQRFGKVMLKKGEIRRKVLIVKKAVNDATLQKAGDIYQYLIALKDCFELADGDTLQIETNGDVSIINDTGGLFQREVKHHFGDKSITDRDIDFWKTLANWYTDYERVKKFSDYILSTTATIQSNSPFYDWNAMKKEEKLKILKDIGAGTKKKEEIFRNQYNKIFDDSYNEYHDLEHFFIKDSASELEKLSNQQFELKLKIEWSNEWGKLLRTAATTNALSQYQSNVVIYSDIFSEYTPLELMVLEILVCTLICTFVGVLMFFFSLYMNKIIAVAVGLALAIALFPVLNMHPLIRYKLAKFIPTVWAELARIATVDHTYYWLPSLMYMVLFLLVGLAIMTGFIMYKIRHVEFNWDNEDM